MELIFISVIVLFVISYTRMVDFQEGGLRKSVYKLLAKLNELVLYEDMPKFKTSYVDNKVWKCELKVPGVHQTAVGWGDTEAESISGCAEFMLEVLKRDHSKNQYDPKDEESIFRDDIEYWFGNLKYDCRYMYYCSHCDVLVREKDEDIRKFLIGTAIKDWGKEFDDESEIVDMCSIVSIRLLMREEKKNLS